MSAAKSDHRFRALINAVARLLPRRSDYAGLTMGWRDDVAAGISVGVVALPLALAFGVSTGVGAAAGLTTAIVAGIVAAVFGGSNVQVSGMSGAMAVVLVPVVARFGVETVLVVGLIAGVVLIAAGLFGIGRYLAYVPWPVIEGFTLGVAIIIFLQQVPAAFGVETPKGDNAALVAGQAALDGLSHAQPAALVLVGIVAAVMALATWLHRALPASLLAVVISTVIAEVGQLDVARVGTLPSSLPTPAVPAVSFDVVSQLVPAGLAIAALAALESLLSAKVADGMSGGPAHDPDRELFGQGLANVASSLSGGMPATGAVARTGVSVRSGARTRVAAIVHSLLLIAVVLWAGTLVGRVPFAVLAGVLMVTAVRMIDVRNLRSVVRATRGDAAVLVLTAGSTIVFDLVVAVQIGIAVAAVLALRSIASATPARAEPLAIEFGPNGEDAGIDEHIVTYSFDGALFFGAAQRFFEKLSTISDVGVVVLRLPHLQVLDATGAQALGEIVTELERRGITVLLKGARAEHRRTLAAVGALDRLAHANHLFDDLDTALDHARLHVVRAQDRAKAEAAA